MKIEAWTQFWRIGLRMGIGAVLALLMVLVVTWGQAEPYGRQGAATGRSKAELFYDLSAPYPIYPVRPGHFAEARKVYQQGTLFCTVRSDPGRGYRAFVVHSIYINPKWEWIASPWTYYSARTIVNLEVMLVNWEGGYPDTLTQYLLSDTTVRNGYIPISGLGGVFNWPTVEGNNSWVTLGSADRSSTYHHFAMTVKPLIEGTDSLELWLRPYRGAPTADTTWQTVRYFTPNSVYTQVEWSLLRGKGDLYGRRLRVIYYGGLPKPVDIFCTGLTPAGKTGFVRMYAFGYGGAFNLWAVRPWSADPPYTRLRSVRPNFTFDAMLEEDLCIFGRALMKTTLASAPVAGATSITVNALPHPWSYYVPPENANSYEGNMCPILIQNETDVVDTTSTYWRNTAITDNGDNTWTLAYNSAGVVSVPTENYTSLHFSADKGDTVIFTGNWLWRGTGGEDWPALGGYYDATSRFWGPEFGSPAVRASDYALDSVAADGSTAVRGCSFYRMYGRDKAGFLPMEFHAPDRLFYYRQKTRISKDAGAADSIWRCTWEYQSTLIYYTNDLLAGNAGSAVGTIPPQYRESWTASAGDGILDDRMNVAASWADSMRGMVANSVYYTDTATYTLPFDFTSASNLKIQRIHFPFATGTGAAPWNDSLNGKGKVLRRAYLSFWIKNFVYTQGTGATATCCYEPWWTDSTELAVTRDTTSSLTAITTADFRDALHDTIGGGGVRMCGLSREFQEKYIEVRIPLQTAGLLSEGQNTMLLVRFLKYDVQQVVPVSGTARNPVWTIAFSEHINPGVRPKFTVEYDLQ